MSGIKLQYLNGLGLVAKTKRVIKPGRHYDIYFPKPERTNPIINKDGSVIDTVEYCEKIVRQTLNDTKKIAHIFKHKTLEQTCSVIFKFIYDHIQYEEDKPNVEQLRRPARAWYDRKGDCDCMSIFASSILTNLGITHKFRIVKMYGRDWYQHIYVIVPKPGKSDMSNRNNYIVIDPVLDNFNQEAPKINHKKDFTMKNLAGLSGIPIQFLNGVDESLKFGEEFNGLEGFSGTSEELGREWDRRMKTHLVNTHAYIKRNPKRVSAFYQPEAILGAYRELIGAWDSENAREGALDRLSKVEESFLQPHLQGLGDILGGPDDRLFAMMNADINGMMGLGDLGKKRGGGGGGKRPATKKAAARKAARAASKPAKKRGAFTKIKQANKKIVAAHKKVGKKALEVKRKVDKKAIELAKKVGKLAVKGATWPIIAGTIMAMKVNAFKIGSRLYWGLFPKAEAMQHGVLPDYWEAANKSYKYLLDIFTKKLMGSEAALRQSIITGRAASVAKRGTHGLGYIGDNNAMAVLQGFDGLGFPPAVAAALITAGVTVLLPVTKALSNNMGGKKKTANSEPEVIDENIDPNTNTDTGEEVSESEAAHVEDNYNNEVVEAPIEQEPEIDGSVSTEGSVDGVDYERDWGIGSEREIDPQFGDLGRKIKSKKGTKVEKRVKADKIAKKSKKAAKKQTRIDKIKNPKKKARKQSKLDKKKYIQNASPLSSEEKSLLVRAVQRKGLDMKVVNQYPASKARAIIVEQKHIEDATAMQKMPKTKLIDKLKNAITKIKSKKAAGEETTEKENALVRLTNQGIERVADTIQNKSPEEIFDEAKSLIRTGSPSDSQPEDGDAAKGGGATNAGGGPTDDSDDSGSEGMSTGKKLGLVAIAGLALFALSKMGKKKASVAGLGDTEEFDGLGKFTKKKHHKNVYELRKDSEKVQKMLKNKGVKLPHGYEVKNRLNGAKARTIKIK